MKKFRGTRYAHIGTSYTPAMDAEIAKLEAAILNRRARLNAIALKIQNLYGENLELDLEHWGE